MITSPGLRRLVPALAAGLALLAVSCTGDDDGTVAPSTTDGAAASTSAAPADPEVSAAGISDERCQANREAGTITYLSGFDFAATAAIVDVVMAADKGYFERLCLDVDLRPGFSTTNYPIVAAGEAQFASAGSFTELVQNNVNDADLVALVDYGKTAIEGLVVRAQDTIDTLVDLRGRTIGIKGAVPPSIVAMMATAGVRQGDWNEVLLDGFDPVAHLQTSIDALPVYKSNEPAQLDAAGVAYRMFDPLDYDIPGSFGVLYTSRSFLDDHPSAAQDFVRAALAGYADAAADPEAAVAASVARIDAAGNPNFLSPTGEAFRWSTESALIAETTPTGELPGLVDGALLQAEIDAMVDAGVLSEAPELAGTYDEAVGRDVIGADGKVVMPSA